MPIGSRSSNRDFKSAEQAFKDFERLDAMRRGEFSSGISTDKETLGGDALATQLALNKLEKQKLSTLNKIKQAETFTTNQFKAQEKSAREIVKQYDIYSRKVKENKSLLPAFAQNWTASLAPLTLAARFVSTSTANYGRSAAPFIAKEAAMSGGLNAGRGLAQAAGPGFFRQLLKGLFGVSTKGALGGAVGAAAAVGAYNIGKSAISAIISGSMKSGQYVFEKGNAIMEEAAEWDREKREFLIRGGMAGYNVRNPANTIWRRRILESRGSGIIADKVDKNRVESYQEYTQRNLANLGIINDRAAKVLSTENGQQVLRNYPDNSFEVTPGSDFHRLLVPNTRSSKFIENFAWSQGVAKQGGRAAGIYPMVGSIPVSPGGFVGTATDIVNYEFSRGNNVKGIDLSPYVFNRGVLPGTGQFALKPIEQAVHTTFSQVAKAFGETILEIAEGGTPYKGFESNISAKAQAIGYSRRQLANKYGANTSMYGYFDARDKSIRSEVELLGQAVYGDAGFDVNLMNRNNKYIGIYDTATKVKMYHGAEWAQMVDRYLGRGRTVEQIRPFAESIAQHEEFLSQNGYRGDDVTKQAVEELATLNSMFKNYSNSALSHFGALEVLQKQAISVASEQPDYNEALRYGGLRKAFYSQEFQSSEAFKLGKEAGLWKDEYNLNAYRAMLSDIGTGRDKGVLQKILGDYYMNIHGGFMEKGTPQWGFPLVHLLGGWDRWRNIATALSNNDNPFGLQAQGAKFGISQSNLGNGPDASDRYNQTFNLLRRDRVSPNQTILDAFETNAKLAVGETLGLGPEEINKLKAQIQVMVAESVVLPMGTAFNDFVKKMSSSLINWLGNGKKDFYECITSGIEDSFDIVKGLPDRFTHYNAY